MDQFSSRYRFLVGDEVPKIDSISRNGGLHALDSAKNSPDTTFVKFLADEKATKNVQRIVELCKQQGLRIVIYQAPLPPEIEDLTDRSVSDRFITEFASRWGLDYWNYSRLYYDRPELFFDRHHLNSDGTRLFSLELGRRLLQDSLK